ncbi:hypothetical protein FHG66_02685 [Rubellimicrobium rubrum]|uniref:Uncharacterized protein n=1 Tax=Rubellimicrobium rubrum TaxID=2585369 RepID=A0A5C4N5Y4_9RHOB|nr:DUF6638 family protein [Rubellimicrobium rubrum]TNC52462.1 hypothetical protein FHG66_02685 [Rubellimicrobium rubrum]
MRRLIEKGLMFGGLVLVDSPVLVERYKRALKHLTGKETALPDFHIDMSGFSPEIGDELGDEHYLNPPGFNRQFILLTTDQKKAPLLNARFSTSRGVLRQFIEANEAELFALTARDAVAGELVNSVYAADSPARLFDIRQVTVEADTTQGTVATAERLTGLIDRFKTEPDAWWDDTLIGEMIQLAGVTGDLSRNPVRLRSMTFEQDDFWTSHFGGVYILRSVPHPAAIVAGGKHALGPLPIADVLDLTDRTGIARFLSVNELAEPIVTGRGAEVAAVLRQKMDFIVAEVAGSEGHVSEATTRRDLRALARRYAGRLPQEWEGLAQLVAWAEDGARWPRITSDHPAYFYTLRAKRTPDADLVNMLLAELCPLDIRQLFICHKELFYRLYRTWSEAKQAFVAEVLAREYMVDKAGTRDALFGPEETMDEPAAPVAGPWGAPAKPSRPQRGDDIIDRVGPWDSLRRR